MTRAAAAIAEEAADALLGWLSTQPARSPSPPSTARPESGPSLVEGDAEPSTAGFDEVVSGEPDPVGSVPDRWVSAPGAEMRPAMRLPATDWLHHTLSISGPPAEVGTFRQLAAGAGMIPWHLDLDRLEEDYFHLLVAAEQRSLSVAGARIFARQLRDAVASRHDLAVARVGRSQACPFDLHALVPVPHDILLLGPDDPRALDWLWTHWGTTQALRHVSASAPVPGDNGEKSDHENVVWRLSFWSADWTPWRALQTIERRWPGLRFGVRPTYEPP
jgi:hypothetical protein